MEKTFNRYGFRYSNWKTAAVCIALLICGCKHKDATSPATVQSVKLGAVEFYRPSSGEKFSTTILPYAQADLSFKSSGLVESIRRVEAGGSTRFIAMGDSVTIGMELARVRTLDYKQKVDQAEAQLKEAQAQLASAEGNQKTAVLDYTRATNLLQSESMTKQNYDQATARSVSANGTVAQARAAVDAARSNVAQAQLALSDTAIRAPFNGVVIARKVELGTLAGSSTAAFTVADIHQVKADFSVPDTALATLRLGQKQMLFLDTNPEPLTGTISSISPQADQQSRVFVVEVTLQNPGNRIKPGMIGTLAISNSRDEAPCLVVPLGALTQAAGTSHFAVYTIQNRGGRTIAVVQPVQVGKTYGNKVEILSGVKQGQPIVVAGAETLQDGEAVQVQE
jgi:multidrug efflux system membrane fusion protein